TRARGGESGGIVEADGGTGLGHRRSAIGARQRLARLRVRRWRCAECRWPSADGRAMTWEERWHPLRREWVVVSSHRDERPWQGERVGRGDAPRALPPYIQDCYLCPG